MRRESPTRGGGESTSSSPRLARAGGIAGSVGAGMAALALILSITAVAFYFVEHSSQKDAQRSDNARFDRLEARVDNLEKKNRELERRLRELENSTCSACTGVFVGVGEYNATVGGLNDTVVEQGVRLDALENETIALAREVEALSNETCGECSSLVNKTTFDAFAHTTDVRLDELDESVADIQSKDFILSGLYGSFTGLLAPSRNAPAWTMTPEISCNNRTSRPVYVNLIPAQGNIQHQGVCPGTNRAIFVTVFNPGGGSGYTLVCPCEDSLFDIGVSVSNVFMRRHNLGAPGRNASLGPLTSGGQISVGFVYALPSDRDRYNFFTPGPWPTNPWPTPPIATFTWTNGYPKDNRSDDSFVTFADSRQVYLARNLSNGDSNACYKLVLVLQDNFARGGADEGNVLEGICNLDPSARVRMGYEFVLNAPNTQAPVFSVNLQRLGWQGPPPRPPP